MRQDGDARTITATDADGRRVAVALAAVLAVTADPVDPGRTRLHTAEGIVTVDGAYEAWMTRLSSGWTGT